jgi:hypothetical protein
MAESKTPDANYAARNDIVLQDDTTFVKDVAGNLHVPAATVTQHVTKMDAEALAKEARAATAFGGAVVGLTRRGKK